MDQDEKFAERKSRIFHQKVGKTPEWRSVGSVTIISPGLDRPLFLEEMGYTIFFHESKEQLRDAIVVLERLQENVWKGRFWVVVATVIVLALVRAVYYLSQLV
ncbi:MAG: hypothetical protein IT419_17630 [Planctomycetes bacterium]|nr:hypothetical protein [Planctomycetota bacterium]